MTSRIAFPQRLGQPDPWMLDRLLALAFAVAAEIEILISDRFTPENVLTQLSVVALSLPLAWRRRSPIAATVGVMAAVVIGSASSVDPLGTSIVAGLVAVWSAARHTDRPTAQGSLAIALVGFWTAALMPPNVAAGYVLGDGVWASGLTLGTWGLGRALRNRRLLALTLADRADRLERDQEERARLAVADERSRIARELHDIVAHNVSTMVVQAGAGRRVVVRDPSRAGEAFASIENAGRQALAEMRRLLGILRTDSEGLALAPQPSLAHLDDLLDRVRETGLPVELTVVGEPHQLPAGIDVSAYRIIQEGLTNTIKHAGQARAEVVVRYGERDLGLEVVDDGRGSDGVANGGRGGHGLVGMRERVTLYGGSLETGSLREGGYAVRARLPVDPSAS
jgi:signal transduction histidine kinase